MECLLGICGRIEGMGRIVVPIKKLALLLVGAAALPELFDAIKLQYQLVLNFFHLEDAGMVLARGVKDIGDIEGTKALKEAYNMGVLVSDEIPGFVQSTNETCSNLELLNHLDRLHTTELGIIRIKKNLSLDTDDVVTWCRDKIGSAHAMITRRGKNWYVDVDDLIITVNARSYTIITAHREKRVEKIP